MKRAPAKSDVCVLVSGGLDSCVLLAKLATTYRRVYPLFIRQGLLWENQELAALRRFTRAIHLPGIQPVTVLPLPVRSIYGEHWSITGRRSPGARTPDEAVYLPGRNLMLLTQASVFCAAQLIPVIALGTLGHNPFPDATPVFFRSFARLAGKALNHPLRVVAPFRTWDKPRVIRLGRNWPLHLSFSCISPQNGQHCGRCNKCAERQRAFRQARVSDPSRYATEAS
jgi:7-cyano-7-deazaguanine synthase